MERIKEFLIGMNENLASELIGVKKMTGKMLENFCDTFDLPNDIDLYYNNSNIVILDESIMSKLSRFFEEEHYIGEFKLKDYNHNMTIIQHINIPVMQGLFDN